MGNVLQEEIKFYNKIKDNCDVLFDVGACDDSTFLQEAKEVHYFEPFEEFYKTLSNSPCSNKKSVFNCFGLGQKEETLKYYKDYIAFHDRKFLPDAQPTCELPIKRADEYVAKHGIESIDFLKIDVEGFELDVLLGFGDFLKNIKYIQFEYGGTYSDRGIKLAQVTDLLQTFNFTGFSKLVSTGLEEMTDFSDDFTYANIVCYNKNKTENFW